MYKFPTTCVTTFYGQIRLKIKIQKFFLPILRGRIVRVVVVVSMAKKNPGAPLVNYEKNNIPGGRFMENRYGNITRLNESR